MSYDIIKFTKSVILLPSLLLMFQSVLENAKYPWHRVQFQILKSEGNLKVDRRMTRPNLTLLFEPRPFRTIFSTWGRTVWLIYVQVIVSILLSLYFSSTKSSLNWDIWKVVFFYEKLSTNVWRKDLQFRKLSSDFERRSHLAFFSIYLLVLFKDVYLLCLFTKIEC